MGAIFGLAGVVIVFVIGIPLMALASAANSPALLVLFVVLLVLAVVALGVISSTLQGIYTAALYRYATEGTTGGMFDDDIVKNAFRQK